MGENMKIALALAFFAASASAVAAETPRTAKASGVPLLCTSSGQKTAGLKKICYYSCRSSEGAIMVAAYDACPRWEPRWRLNRNAQFGPSENVR
jgi:hypothetical protein